MMIRRPLIVPLEIVWAWVYVEPVGTEWTRVAGRVMDEAVSNHFVFTLEALSPFTAGTSYDRTVMRTD